MYVVIVTAFIKPERAEHFKEAILDNARNTRLEPGNVRFDVLQGEDDPTRFTLYEAYRTKDDMGKHQQTAHYLRWKEKTVDDFVQARTRTANNAVFFGEGIL